MVHLTCTKLPVSTPHHYPLHEPLINFALRKYHFQDCRCHSIVSVDIAKPNLIFYNLARYIFSLHIFTLYNDIYLQLIRIMLWWCFVWVFFSWKYSVVITYRENFTCVTEKVLVFPIKKKTSSGDS